MLREIQIAMHVRQKTVHVTIPLTVLGIVAIVPQVLKETHTSSMVAKVLANKHLDLVFFFFFFWSSSKQDITHLLHEKESLLILSYLLLHKCRGCIANF